MSVFLPRGVCRYQCCCVQFNFVGRILGPRGLTAKQLEAETGCKIMVRGKGSMRDKKKVNTLMQRTTMRDGLLSLSRSGQLVSMADLRNVKMA